MGTQTPTGDGTHRVRDARREDLSHLKAIEDAADQTFVELFGALDWEEASSGEWRARQPGFLLVVDDEGEVRGFAHVLWLEGTAHLEQLAVHPAYHRRGLGTELLRAAEARARDEGYAALTLSTYSEVPWNAQYYAKQGYEVVEPATPLLRRLVAKEEEMGLMRYGPRVVMRIALG